MPDNLETIKVTKAELNIILAIRTLIPYEVVEITKSKDGKPDNYIVHRSYKYILNEQGQVAVRS